MALKSAERYKGYAGNRILVKDIWREEAFKVVSGSNGCDNTCKLGGNDGGERKYVWSIKRVDGGWISGIWKTGNRTGDRASNRTGNSTNDKKCIWKYKR